MKTMGENFHRLFSWVAGTSPAMTIMLVQAIMLAERDPRRSAP
jgi:hypothetical protein